MNYETLLFKIEEGIATITLNKPEKLNSLDLLMRREIKDVLKLIDHNRKVQIVILNGKGNSFCAGGDIQSMNIEDLKSGRARIQSLQEITRNIVNLEQPVIASVHGNVAGAGMSLSLACDFVIAAENSKFSASFINIGLIPDSGIMYLLPAKVGVGIAKDLLISGRRVDSREAKEIGLINYLVENEAIETKTIELSRRVKRLPNFAQGMIKKALNQWPMGIEEMFELEANMQTICYFTDDFNEGKDAFLNKRKSVYNKTS